MYPHAWTKILSRPHSVQRISNFFLNFFTVGLPEDHSVRMNSAIIIPSEGKYDYYFFEDEWMEFLVGVERVTFGMNKATIEQSFESLNADMTVLGQEIFDANIADLHTTTLADWFVRYCARLQGLGLFAFTPSAIDGVTAAKLQASLEMIDSVKAEEWLQVIGTPTTTNAMTAQRMDLLDIAASGDDSRLVDHAKRFFWLPVYTIGDKIWSMDDFTKQRADLENPEAELAKMRTDFAERSRRYNEVLREIRPDDSLRNTIEIIHLYTHLRDARIDLTRIVFCLIAPFYQDLARRMNVSLSCVLNLLNEEILAFLYDGSLPLNVAERSTHVVYAHNATVEILTGKDADDRIAADLAAVLNVAHKEIKGMIAYRGIVQGKARVIHSADQLSELEHGEILVTHHTTPVFVLAMKKAAAIVTDEGGITSHAAIVSRELQIPCITATRHGSSMIQTGDIIEVNADNGTVKIL